ncbi:tRNA preQ1(34) S-adenosylmethionine ribosyltransferase-isomerase QueA [Candidatus Venteria ishoeyi]|uniref:tRNA preQ1(34) S-adenosylmethionine ribosyltransferase-isomerase QueA n=1 Tax=Candidatus Venteria ishoeyi TaxID=1899563 RepID=UPI0025A65905|nr:tRNA preQ1(34) S-adenosylmethionine ribosyltransferase-isomerase QueA [Candidatus Venteria ishoeyi]MDM8546000.1 tRNA preQ1(34) S-adenosylmethionine ribosyltransferase-isomerase QueA [Candidatus Venteria ishoeyi]
MQRTDFHFDLPPELIAQTPAQQRTDSRLLCLQRHTGAILDQNFTDLPNWLKAGDLLVLNNTRVIPARLFAHKPSGGKVEILIERLLGEHQALAHLRASKSPKPGTEIILDNTQQQAQSLWVEGREGALFKLSSPAATPLSALLSEFGHVPLPPYIQRADQQQDKNRYQTVYASCDGAVAAPTAGLHFDQAMLEHLSAQGIEQAFVTLHVGAGTFQPVRADNLDEHEMHAEWLSVSERVCEQVKATKAAGGRVVAVGTTSVRALESAAADGELKPFEGDTRLFIQPGYQFRVVDALLTNFHLSESTLLMLVSAFGGYQEVMQAYRHAVAEQYRFFSYGDAMFFYE